MIIERRAEHGDENLIKELAQKFGLSERFATILYGRGIKSVQEAKEFLYPSLDDLSDPFLMRGMTRAVERIKAVSPDETVVVYGDYDVDGICAATLLTKGLRDGGVNAYVVIPERANGYGLSEEVIELAIENYCPDLLITVDCGISAAEQVEYLKDLGVDVIVTDHHEIPDALPDCITVNCKFNDEYGFNGLCGAGVAFNLLRALYGDGAYKYLDLAALATIADNMPLTGENRVIVKAGINAIKKGDCSYAIKAILSSAKVKEINASALAYSVAPRINAAGRMGDASSALSAFMSDDGAEIDSLVEELAKYNAHRQGDCDDLYRSAKAKLADKSPLLKVNVLHDKNWNTGLVGIVAARLAEETGKPTILFTEQDGMWHGSARSVNSVNVYEALKYASEFIENFGGHAQAAGVTVTEDNFLNLENSLNEYVSTRCKVSDMVSDVVVDEIVDKPLTTKFVDELNLLEPCGTDNPKPIFVEYVRAAYATPLKYGSPHVSFKTANFDYLFFNGYDAMKTLNSPVKKAILFEPSSSVFNGKKYAKGYVRSVLTVADYDDITDYAAFSKQLDSIDIKDCEYEDITDNDAEKLIARAKEEIFGTLFIINSLKTAEKFSSELSEFDKTVFTTCKKGNLSTVCFAPDNEITALYERIVYLDKPLRVTVCSPTAKIYVNTERNGLDCEGVTCDRKTLGEIYLALKRSQRKFASVIDAKKYLGEKYSLKQVCFAVKVFYELGLIIIAGGLFSATDGKGKDLNDSKVYREVSKIIDAQ